MRQALSHPCVAWASRRRAPALAVHVKSGSGRKRKGKMPSPRERIKAPGSVTGLSPT